jgi:hypothetical protein
LVEDSLWKGLLVTVSHYAGDEGLSQPARRGKREFSSTLFQAPESQSLDIRFTEPVPIDGDSAPRDDLNHQRGFSVNIIPIAPNEKLNVSVVRRRCRGCLLY